MAYFLSVLTISILSVLVATRSTFSPARPPAIPLAVRSPYLTTWQQTGPDGGNGGYLAGQWPTFWNGAVTGWTGLVKVDNVTYTWMGNPVPLPTAVNQISFTYTSTRSIFTMDVAGKIAMKVTFLSPVTPKDQLRQSVPFSYMIVDFKSSDGKTHDVQLYTDISAEWVSGDRSQLAQWSYGVTADNSTSSEKRDTKGWSDSTAGNWHASEAHGKPDWLNMLEHRTRPDTWNSWKSHNYTALEYEALNTSGSSTASGSTASSGGRVERSSTSGSSGSGASGTAPSPTPDTASSSFVSVSSPSGSLSTTSNSPSSSSSSTTGTGTKTTLADSTTIAPAKGNSNPSSGTASGSATTSTNATTTGLENSTPTIGSATPIGTLTGTASAGSLAYHKFWRQLQQEFSEDSDQAAWGYWYYATENVKGLTHQSGADVDVRGQFENSSALLNTEDSKYRAINDAYPVFGFALDFGTVGSEVETSLFTINLAQENSIQFDGSVSSQSVPSLWTSYFSDELSALAFFYNDWETSASLSNELDNQVESDSVAAAGQNYSVLTQLAVRQAWGSIKLCGNLTTTYIFLKEMSSNGDIQTVDVIFPFHLILLYMNPRWLRLILEPLFINQEGGQWPHMYSIHDLGRYPNATGHVNGVDEMQPLEECGNMLIMTLAYVQRTGDTAYLNTHYKLLNQWTQYLVNDSLYPQNQISTDDFAGMLSNQTNLALKGMIGIQAMALIANMTGNTSDGANYTSIAQRYITQWLTLGNNFATNRPHATLNYGDMSSYSLLYNLYADALLQTHLVPSSVYTQQSNFYPTVENTYGVPLDTRDTNTKNDWEMFCAAIATESTRDMFIGDIAKWINETPTNHPVTDLYDSISGDYPNGLMFEARPVVGGWFALLALNHSGIPSNVMS